MLRKSFDKTLSVKDFFDYPTLRELAAQVKNTDYKREIRPIKKDLYYPLSPSQRRIYVLNQMDGTGVTYNLAGAMRILGQLDLGEVHRVMKELAVRHESLRTRFDLVGGNIAQIVEDDVEIEIHVHENSSVSDSSKHVAEFLQPFDLNRAPLIRICAIRESSDCHILLFDMHHIISDGASIQILIDEFILLYERKSLPSPKIGFKDAVFWMEEQKINGKLEREKQYWKTQLDHLPTRLALPYDFPLAEFIRFRGDTHILKLPSELLRTLRNSCAEKHFTINNVMLAALYIVLHKYTGQDDILIGSSVDSRTHYDLEKVVGMFANTVVLRNRPQSEKPLFAFLREVQQTTIEMVANQRYPFEDILSDLRIETEGNRNPLFDVFFVHQTVQVNKTLSSGITVQPYRIKKLTAKFDLLFSVMESESEIEVGIEYNTSLFKESTITRFATYYLNTIEKLLEDDSLLIKDAIEHRFSPPPIKAIARN